jgi:hypothetical protein
MTSLGAKYAQVLWYREDLRLAIRPHTKRDDRAFKLTFAKGKRGGSFSDQSFLNYIQWQPSGPFTTTVHWNEKEGLLEAILPRDRVGVEVRVKNRK